MQVSGKTEQTEGIEIARQAGLGASLARPSAMPKTMVLGDVLANGPERALASEVDIGRAIRVPATPQLEGCFQRAQRGRLGRRIAKLELRPVLGACAQMDVHFIELPGWSKFLGGSAHVFYAGLSSRFPHRAEFGVG